MTGKGEQTRERILAAAETLILQQGFAGTSLDNILKKTKLTKGAFFHHFKDKADLARALIERVAQEDYAIFLGFDAEADAFSDDPLERVFYFQKRFEDLVDGLPTTVIGCMYTTYTYESMHLDPAVNKYVSDALKRWAAIYERKFAAVLDRYKPAQPVSAKELSEMIVSLIEGGFVLARAHRDGRAVSRQSRQFRKYLEVLFNRPGLSARFDKPLKTEKTFESA